MGPSLALAVPQADRDGVYPGRGGTFPKPQHARRRSGPQLRAGDRQHRHGSVGLAGNAWAKESVKGMAENFGTGSAEAVQLPPQNPSFLRQLFPGLQKQKA